MFFKKSVESEGDSDFSKFIRNASAAEKKKVYTEVIRESIEMQKKTMEKARAKARKEKTSNSE